MAINIQNIIDQITTRAAAADSTMNTQYLLSLSKAVLAMNNTTGIIEYKVKSELPDVDSSILGNFAYIAARADLDSVYGDSYGAFYYAARIGSNDSGWDRIRTGKDSDVENPLISQAQGSISGYTTAGSPPAPGTTNIIDKFPFAVDADATDVGDATVNRYGSVGASSSTHGYASAYGTVIDKFPFAVDANATDVGDLTVGRDGQAAGQSSTVSGYVSGGQLATFSDYTNVIDKFPFSTDANATDVGDLSLFARNGLAGQSSIDYGWTSGGRVPNAYGNGITNKIDKFPFATDGNATDIADLSRTVQFPYGQSSYDYGYTSGGINTIPPAPSTNTIDKFPFASGSNATDVGDLTRTVSGGSAQSSTVSGYTSGGTDTIDKFSFSVDANATDVGNLTQARGGASGQQV